jgi:hypothetical protein
MKKINALRNRWLGELIAIIFHWIFNSVLYRGDNECIFLHQLFVVDKKRLCYFYIIDVMMTALTIGTSSNFIAAIKNQCR